MLGAVTTYSSTFIVGYPIILIKTTKLSSNFNYTMLFLVDQNTQEIWKYDSVFTWPERFKDQNTEAIHICNLVHISNHVTEKAMTIYHIQCISGWALIPNIPTFHKLIFVITCQYQSSVCSTAWVSQSCINSEHHILN